MKKLDEALTRAVDAQDFRETERLINEGANVNFLNESNYHFFNILGLAIDNNNSDLIRLLLKNHFAPTQTVEHLEYWLAVGLCPAITAILLEHSEHIPNSVIKNVLIHTMINNNNEYERHLRIILAKYGTSTNDSDRKKLVQEVRELLIDKLAK